ncbi:MAG: DMT family transporter [Nitrosopumilus sp.]|uniref:DMT family transporter n=1 Tax=Nitrosopumilus sp. TaxID=2024843 RepID=UPI00247BC1E4|nr:DMT family transporter [Nitrosopumilus sp.]MCV0392357.1 DMT family transporter [Nitrosopumilus sp.]
MKIVNESFYGFNRQSFASHKGKIALGVLFTLAAAAMEALADVIPKPLMADTQMSPANPLLIVFIIYIVNGAIFTPFTTKSKPLSKFPIKPLYLLTVLGVVEVLSTIFFLYGLKDTTAVNASILGNSEIVFGIIIAMIVLGERIKRKEVLPFLLIGIGAILIPVGADISEYGFMTNFVVGDIMILMSGLFLGIVMTMYKRMGDEFDSKRIIQYTSFIGAAVAMTGILIMGMPFELDPAHLPVILITGVIGVGIPVFFVLIALRYIGAVRTIMVFSTTTVFGVLFSNILLGEEISFANIGAIAMVIAGTYILRDRLARD